MTLENAAAQNETYVDPETSGADATTTAIDDAPQTGASDFREARDDRSVRYEDVSDTDNDAADKLIEQAGGKAALVMAAVFNDAAFPPSFMERFSELVTWANQAAGELSIGNGVGPVSKKTKAEIEEESAEKSRDAFADAMQEVVHDQEEERRLERQEWSRTKHSYFGADLTGKEWGQMGDDVGEGGRFRNWLIEELMKKGKTRKDAEAKANEISSVYKILDKPESEWTEAERAKVETAKADPDYAEYTKKLRQLELGGAAPSVETGISAPAIKQAAAAGSTAASVDARAESFASAPDLTEHYEVALAAKEPLDMPKPVQVASISPKPTVQPSNSGGFDV